MDIISARSPIRARASATSSGRWTKLKRNPVGAEFKRQLEVAPVFFGQGGDGQHDARHVDTLAFGQLAANRDPRFGEVGPAMVDHQTQLAVVEQQLGTGHQRGKNLRVRHAGAAGVAGRGVQVQAEASALDQHHRAVGKSAHAQLGALQVGQDADRAPDLLLEFAQHR